MQVISQAGLQHTYFFHGYWFEPRPEWFFQKKQLDIRLEPFTMEQLGISAVLLAVGFILSFASFINEKMQA